MAWLAIFGILCISLSTTWGFEQVMDPPAAYCAELSPQNFLNIPKLLGSWYGVEYVTHRNMISGERPYESCIFVEIAEVEGSVRQAVSEQPLTTTVKSLKNATKSPIVTPVDIQTKPFEDLSIRASDSYQHLWLAFTEEDEKFEYSLRYNSSRSGFWLASQPHAQGTSDKHGAITGTIQVIRYDDNYLLLTICESEPRQRLFSVILSRRLNFLPREIIKELRDELRARDLPTIYDRPVCNKSTSIQNSLLLVIIALSCYSLQYNIIRRTT